MKKLLFITPGVHYPPTSGYGFRVYNLLKIYSKIFEVILIANSYNARDEDEIREHLGLMTKEFQFVDKRKNYLPKALRQYLHPIQPKSVSKMITPALKSIISSMISKYRTFDFIHIENLRTVGSVRDLLNKKSNTKFILDLDDWESKTCLREVETIRKGGLIKEFKRSIEPKRLYRYEKHVLPLFDWVYICSEIDRQSLIEEFKLNNVVVVPNGIDLPEASEDYAEELNMKERILLYIGSLGYGPNIDAIEYFVQHIFPLILENEPNVQLWIAGNTQYAPKHLFQLAHNSSIRVLGFVEDLRRLYARTDVFIVPLRLGGGTRIKILEAASFKKAIVSTQIGCEGLDFTHGESICIADDPATFSKACLELLNNREKKSLMGKRAHKVVKEKYQWPIIEKNLINLFSKEYEFQI